MTVVTYDCFADRVAVVTGAGGGIGLAIAKALLRQGAVVGMIDVKDGPPLPEDIRRKAHYIQADLTDKVAVDGAFHTIYREYGRLDYLANVAGVLLFGKDIGMVDIDMTVWDRVFAVNLKAMVYTVRNAVPLMLQSGGGAMVHFSTVQAVRGDAVPQDAYQCSKAGVIALSKSLAMQYATRGVRSNAILPGTVDTPLQSRFEQQPGMKESFAQAIPMARVGGPEEVAAAAVFLLSDQASYITGVELPVDGGLLMKY